MHRALYGYPLCAAFEGPVTLVMCRCRTFAGPPVWAPAHGVQLLPCSTGTACFGPCYPGALTRAGYICLPRELPVLLVHVRAAGTCLMRGLLLPPPLKHANLHSCFLQHWHCLRWPLHCKLFQIIGGVLEGPNLHRTAQHFVPSILCRSAILLPCTAFAGRDACVLQRSAYACQLGD
jgi:hypothetical protein